jgi:hypothetical protein
MLDKMVSEMRRGVPLFRGDLGETDIVPSEVLKVLSVIFAGEAVMADSTELVIAYSKLRATDSKKK